MITPGWKREAPGSARVRHDIALVRLPLSIVVGVDKYFPSGKRRVPRIFQGVAVDVVEKDPGYQGLRGQAKIDSACELPRCQGHVDVARRGYRRTKSGRHNGRDTIGAAGEVGEAVVARSISDYGWLT